MSLARHIALWSEDRSWIGRALVIPIFSYIGWRSYADPLYGGPFAGVNMIIHEIGHPLFSYFGEFMHVAGGTIFQLAAPILILIMFLRQPEYFGIPFCGVWFSTNLYGIATYVADARAQELPLVTLATGGGELVEAEHDWGYLLEHFHALSMDTRIASAIRIAAFIVMWSSILAGVWIVWVMARASKTAR